MRERSEIRMGTDRIRSALEKLGKTGNNYPIIMVGGTNGKSSTSYFMAQLLARTGLRVGLFTTPHPGDICKDIQIWEKKSPQDVLGTKIALEDLSVNIKRSADVEVYLTSFELEVCAALLYFEGQGVDVAVMEMGMGGRGDAVNIRPPDLAVITNVSLEHTSFLGETIEKITREKADIIPENGILVTSARQPILGILETIAEERGAELVIPHFEEYIPHCYQLMAEHNKRNACLAMEAVLRFVYHCKPTHASSISTVELLSWAQELRPPEGRLQVIPLEEDIKLILDGAHNPAGFQALFGEMYKRLKDRGTIDLVVVVGILKDKDIPTMAEWTKDIGGKYFCTRPSSPRGEEPEFLVREFRRYHKEVFLAPNVGEAIDMGLMVLEKGGGLILVTGSLYTVADAMEWVEKRR